MPTSQALIHQINTLSVGHGSLALWSLGQAGLVLKGGETIAYLDPYLTNSIDEAAFARQFPSPLAPKEVTNNHVVFCTHEHRDHTDAATVTPLAQASPRATFVGPANSRDILLACAIDDDRISVPQVNQSYTVQGVEFSAIPAAHYGLDYDPERGYRWLGYVITLNGVTLYHTGDTIWFDSLLDHLRPHQIDITAIPVNGRDWMRDRQGIIGNFDGVEALELTVALGADVLIPLHNDLFAGNHDSPAVLAEYQDRRHPRQKVHWLQPGELYYYVKG